MCRRRRRRSARLLLFLLCVCVFFVFFKRLNDSCEVEAVCELSLDAVLLLLLLLVVYILCSKAVWNYSSLSSISFEINAGC